MESERKQPNEILGMPVISICPDCDGDGVLWSVDAYEQCKAERCPRCNCVGFLLDKFGPREAEDEEDLPF